MPLRSRRYMMSRGILHANTKQTISHVSCAIVSHCEVDGISCLVSMMYTEI